MSGIASALTLGGFTFIMAVIWGGPFIRILRLLNIGEKIRVEGPQAHFSKLGTPTMGGWLFIIPVLLITGILNLVSIVSELDLLGNSILLPMLVFLAYALVGAVDDWIGLRGKSENKGLSVRAKFLLQSVIALGAGFVLKFGIHPPELILPGVPETLNLGWFYLPIAALVIVGMSNAVNLTDGLDGLAGLISATAFVVYGIIAMLQGQVFIVRFCFTIVGALFAFLWYNAHPAMLFMGDTGALALGATLGVVALMTGHWALLPVIAIIPVSETISVILQVFYYRRTGGKRLFKMAPLHIHFELSGWSETHVVQRFWLVGLLAGMLGVALALV